MDKDHFLFFLAPDTGAEGGSGGAGEPGGAGNPPQNGGGGGSQKDDLPDDPAELKKLLKAEKDAHKHTVQVHTEMKDKYQKRDSADEKARQEQLKKAGEYERLYGELSPQVEVLKTTTARQEQALATYLKAELAGVPDSMKALIPEGDSVTQLEWIAKAKAAGAFTPGNPPPKGKGPDGNPPPGGKSATMSRDAFDRLPAKERAAFMAKGGTLTD